MIFAVIAVALMGMFMLPQAGIYPQPQNIIGSCIDMDGSGPWKINSCDGVRQCCPVTNLWTGRSDCVTSTSEQLPMMDCNTPQPSFSAPEQPVQQSLLQTDILSGISSPNAITWDASASAGGRIPILSDIIDAIAGVINAILGR